MTRMRSTDSPSPSATRSARRISRPHTIGTPSPSVPARTLRSAVYCAPVPVAVKTATIGQIVRRLQRCGRPFACHPAPAPCASPSWLSATGAMRSSGGTAASRRRSVLLPSLSICAQARSARGSGERAPVLEARLRPSPTWHKAPLALSGAAWSCHPGTSIVAHRSCHPRRATSQALACSRSSCLPRAHVIATIEK